VRGVTDALTHWVVEQQEVAKASVEHNRTAVHVRGCILCGRMDTHVAYRFGLADQPRCIDYEACQRRQELLWSDTATQADMLNDSRAENSQPHPTD
jgi:hypothetical protein